MAADGPRRTSKVSSTRSIATDCKPRPVANTDISRRTKISHDPNNTNWSRSTSGYGHKILRAQGWTPGSCLGARNAAHADTFTATSATHIRIALKDDTLGLGARPKRDLLDEPTGLDAFQDLLGRLNGKSDLELEREQRKRDDIKLARYAEKKWQSPRFISGGFLVHEKIEPLAAKNAEKNDQAPCSKEASDKQQKEAGTDASTEELVDSPMDLPESGVGSDTLRRNALSTEPVGDDDTSEKKKRRKKSKKRKRTGDRDEAEDDDRNKESSKQPTSQPRSETGMNGDVEDSPAEAAKPRERIPMGRHVFRSRHIQQKKRALMDDKSLNEVIDNMFPVAPCLRHIVLTLTDIYGQVVNFVCGAAGRGFAGNIP